ncbi:MAG: SUMF1/EgtB/PvdO family nonheme iron enzyme, partial [Caldilineaceae bacterium]|nr:SUMF1/EgtB/PvdO family nonheme iron enzyme [Caldilineaceae bacterium]
GVIRAGADEMTLGAAQAEALGKYLAKLPVTERREREDRYLTRLIIDPTYRRWNTRYVTLAGGYRPPPQIDPAYRQVLVRGDGPERQIERRPLKNIQEAMSLQPTFVLLAPPGAGKTTVLEKIALDEAHRSLRADGAARLPFFVRLAAQKAGEDPHSFLARMWQIELACTPAEAAAELAATLKQGRLCLLADALNEARRERYDERVQEWESFWRDLPAGNALIFTSRTLDYQGELAAPQVEIDPLTDAQIEEFAGRYLDDAGRGAALAALLADRHATLLPLARTPYYLLLMVEIFAESGDLPANRARLFEGFVQRLLDRERAKHLPGWIDARAQHVALGELAYAMQELGEGTLVDRAWACNAMPAQVTLRDGTEIPAPPAAVLHFAHGASLLAAMPENGVRFVHHLLQEYFAAEELLRRHDAGDDLADRWRVPWKEREMPPAPRGEWDPLPPPPPTGWEQTTILAASLYPDLVDAVLAVNPALAARCEIELRGARGEGREEGRGARGELRHEDAPGVQPDPAADNPDLAPRNSPLAPPAEPAPRPSQLAPALLERMASPAVHLRSHIEAGLLLGRLGDPRFAVERVQGVRVILPPAVRIAGGKATIGSGRWPPDSLADKDEKPRHDVMLAPYALGRYPVTNAEYACFMAAGGYDDETLWTAGGRYWRRGEPVPGEDDPVDWYIDQWRRNRERPARIAELLKQGVYTPRGAEQWNELVTWDEERYTALIRSWYPLGQQFTQPRYWDDDTLTSPSQPVVGITWYEAAAYAAWLARLTGGAGGCRQSRSGNGPRAAAGVCSRGAATGTSAASTAWKAASWAPRPWAPIRTAPRPTGSTTWPATSMSGRPHWRRTIPMWPTARVRIPTRRGFASPAAAAGRRCARWCAGRIVTGTVPGAGTTTWGIASPGLSLEQLFFVLCLLFLVMKTYRNLFPQITSFANLDFAFRRARRGKRDRPEVATFEYALEPKLFALESIWQGQTSIADG